MRKSRSWMTPYSTNKTFTIGHSSRQRLWNRDKCCCWIGNILKRKFRHWEGRNIENWSAVFRFWLDIYSSGNISLSSDRAVGYWLCENSVERFDDIFSKILAWRIVYLKRQWMDMRLELIWLYEKRICRYGLFLKFALMKLMICLQILFYAIRAKSGRTELSLHLAWAQHWFPEIGHSPSKFKLDIGTAFLG